MNNDEKEHESGRSGLKGFYSYKNTFDEDSVWLEIPKHGELSLVEMDIVLFLCKWAC
jgi:hypothetical protein